MKIILSPTKTMADYPQCPSDSREISSLTAVLVQALKSLPLDGLQKLFRISDGLAGKTASQIQALGTGDLTPAVLSYEGIQYRYLDVKSLKPEEQTYLKDHLRIISALYGLLRPWDGIQPYRLDFDTGLRVDGKPSLYDFWGDRLYRELYADKDAVINLCSEEYSKAIRPHLKPEDVFIDVVFLEKKGDKYLEKGTYCKMARGLFCRYLAQRRITDIRNLKDFAEAGYHYQEDLSTESKIVFAR